MYAVKEIFYTLQGEGFHTGRPAVFCRFSGCNLWTGREADRHKAVCKFCDTDFFGVGPDGGRFATAAELASRVADLWPREHAAGSRPYVVCTGGEPLLQLDAGLVEAFHAHGFEVAIETNGTQPAPAGIDWICVSPKANAPLTLVNGDELKLVYPQAEPEAQPECFERLSFRHFSLQPMDGPNLAENVRRTVEYCLAHPRWRLSLQTHKLLGLR
ncbi:MAG TPA: 7-carboxy-7-deazaguanine synthase [Gemmatimonadaceae bacterium]|nr:7-carboxy-7-deazaguanine synthase [Gemmatimonadaceae bacterium]